MSGRESLYVKLRKHRRHADPRGLWGFAWPKVELESKMDRIKRRLLARKSEASGSKDHTA